MQTVDQSMSITNDRRLLDLDCIFRESRRERFTKARVVRRSGYVPEHLEVFGPTALAGETIAVYRCLFMLRGQQNKAHLERFALSRHIAHASLSVFVQDSLVASCTRREIRMLPKVVARDKWRQC